MRFKKLVFDDCTEFVSEPFDLNGNDEQRAEQEIAKLAGWCRRNLVVYNSCDFRWNETRAYDVPDVDDHELGVDDSRDAAQFKPSVVAKVGSIIVVFFKGDEGAAAVFALTWA